MEITNILNIVFYTFTLCLHSVGLVLLYMVRSKIVETSFIQYVYIVNLSVVELLSSLLYVLHTVLIVNGKPALLFYIHCLQNGGVFVWYTLVMIMLTFDRFLEVYLNIRYYIFWSLKKTIVVLVMIAVIPLAFTLYLFTIKDKRDLFRLLTFYCWPICECSFIVVALATYGYFLKKIKSHRVTQQSLSLQQSNIETQATSDLSASVQRSASRFRQAARGFTLPTLLISTYLIFWVFPDMFYLVSILHEKTYPAAVQSVFTVMYMLAFASDAVIYIFGYKPVRNLLRKKLCSK